MATSAAEQILTEQGPGWFVSVSVVHAWALYRREGGGMSAVCKSIDEA